MNSKGNKPLNRAESARQYALREMPLLERKDEKTVYRRPWVRKWLEEAHRAGAEAERKRALRRAKREGK